MINNSFAHIPSISVKTETRIWQAGAPTMEDFLISPPDFLTPKKCQKIKEYIDLSQKKIRDMDFCWFLDNLPSKEHWRIFKQAQCSAVYLDIETTGLDPYYDRITSIALYDGQDIFYFSRGENLDDFKDIIKNYTLLVTYNGKTFDIPFIEKAMDIKLNQAHLDLRYILKSLGFSGGLKSCEHQMGIGREGALSDVDGFMAIKLWNEYVGKNNKKALETLLAYNIEDVLGLEHLMIEAYNLKLGELGLDNQKIAHCDTPANPFDIDENLVSKLSCYY